LNSTRLVVDCFDIDIVSVQHKSVTDWWKKGKGKGSGFM